jgi:hypothetical protein
VRTTLEAALVACADSPWKAKARRFLRGLSYDELQYIAGYLGACILESSSARVRRTRSEDQELKMILVLEYLHRAGWDRPPGLSSSWQLTL